MDVAAAKTDRLGLRTSTRQRALLEAASDAEGVTESAGHLSWTRYGGQRRRLISSESARC